MDKIVGFRAISIGIVSVVLELPCVSLLVVVVGVPPAEATVSKYEKAPVEIRVVFVWECTCE